VIATLRCKDSREFLPTSSYFFYSFSSKFHSDPFIISVYEKSRYLNKHIKYYLTLHVGKINNVPHAISGASSKRVVAGM
jgi:hypothetical protein